MYKIKFKKYLINKKATVIHSDLYNCFIIYLQMKTRVCQS